MRAKVIKGITYLMCILLILSVAAVDSASIIPLIVVGISLAWLCIIVAANTDR